MNTTLIAKLFGVTEETLRAQYQRNADTLLRMARQADRTGRKVNGYTAVELYDLEAVTRSRAEGRGEEPQSRFCNVTDTMQEMG